MPYTDPKQRSANNKAYYLANKEEFATKSKAFRLANKEKISTRKKAYYFANKENVALRNKAYRLANPEKVVAKRRAYYFANREKIIAKRRAYVKANSSVIQFNETRRRAQKANAPINDLTRKQWKTIKAHYKFKCVYCGRKPKRLTQDHITPLSKGGSHTLANIVTACLSCNSQKHANPPPVPVQPLLLDYDT